MYLYCMCTGIGQVVLQVAGATGCKCYGIEKAETPAMYAKVSLVELCISFFFIEMLCLSLFSVSHGIVNFRAVPIFAIADIMHVYIYMKIEGGL